MESTSAPERIRVGIAAIAADEHVLVEKPVGLDATQTGTMHATAEGRVEL